MLLQEDRDVLRTLMLEFLRSATARYAFADYEAILADIRDGVQSALSDFAQALNARSRVPTEVLGACFAWLPFKDRVQTTAVCRGWFRLRWETLCFGQHQQSITSLASSGPFAILDPRLYGFGFLFQDAAIDDLIRPHASRVVLIDWRAEGSASLLKVFAESSTKELKSLEFRHRRGPETARITLPDDLPHISTLEKLTLVGYVAVLNGNSTTVMGSITNLELDITAWSGPCRLFELVPNVVRLVLNFWQTRIPLGPKPRSLKEFHVAAEEDSGEYDETVHSWSARDLLETASFARPADWTPLFSFAERIWSDGWIISTIDRVPETSLFEITGLGLSAHPTIFIGDQFDGASDSGSAISAFRDSVTSLELNVDALVFFLSTGATFPRATALTVSLLDFYDFQTLQDQMEISITGEYNAIMALPALQTIVVHTADEPAEADIAVADSAAMVFLAETLRPMLLHHIQCGTPRIPELRLELPSFLFLFDRGRGAIELMGDCADDVCVLPSTKQGTKKRHKMLDLLGIAF